jgi:excisionase family DNA binding protein
MWLFATDCVNNQAALFGGKERKSMVNATQLRTYPNLLTISEAAEQLRISRWTMYQLIRANELKTLTIASRRFVASDDLATFINERKEQGS